MLLTSALLIYPVQACESGWDADVCWDADGIVARETSHRRGAASGRKTKNPHYRSPSLRLPRGPSREGLRRAAERRGRRRPQDRRGKVPRTAGAGRPAAGDGGGAAESLEPERDAAKAKRRTIREARLTTVPRVRLGVNPAIRRDSPNFVATLLKSPKCIGSISDRDFPGFSGVFHLTAPASSGLMTLLRDR